MEITIQRKGVYLIDFGNEEKGSVQAGVRPGIVVQNNIGNHYSSTTIVIPCSTSSRNSLPVHLQLTQDDMEIGNLPYRSILQCEQIRVINTYSILKMFGKVNLKKMEEIDRVIQVSLGISTTVTGKTPFVSNR